MVEIGTSRLLVSFYDVPLKFKIARLEGPGFGKFRRGDDMREYQFGMRRFCKPNGKWYNAFGPSGTIYRYQYPSVAWGWRHCCGTRDKQDQTGRTIQDIVSRSTDSPLPRAIFSTRAEDQKTVGPSACVFADFLGGLAFREFDIGDRGGGLASGGQLSQHAPCLVPTNIPFDRIGPHLPCRLAFQHLQQRHRNTERVGNCECMGDDAGGMFGPIEACDNLAGSRLGVGVG